MTKLWIQIKRIWGSCRNITSLFVRKAVKGTGRLAKIIAAALTFVISIVMFVVLLSGLMLTATGVSFFNMPIIRGSPKKKSQQLSLNFENGGVVNI